MYLILQRSNHIKKTYSSWSSNNSTIILHRSQQLPCSIVSFSSILQMWPSSTLAYPSCSAQRTSTVTDTCLSNLLPHGLPLEQLYTAKYLSDTRLTDTQCIFWCAGYSHSIHLSTYLDSLPFSSLSHHWSHPFPQLPHSINCQVIKNLPIHHLESIHFFTVPIVTTLLVKMSCTIPFLGQLKLLHN